MKTSTINTLSKLKKKHPSLYEEIRDRFHSNGKRLGDFELDYFLYDQKKHEFVITMSSGIAEELEIFDMNGEMIDDEVSVHDASFDRTMSKEDFFDPDSNFMREMLDENENDNDY